jgi:hypothetical protein
MPGGKGWWRLIRGIETLERQKWCLSVSRVGTTKTLERQAWHSHAGAWERSRGNT